MRFWDREREIRELKGIIESEPNSILFVYGPKSSGKSTLVEKVIEEIREEKKELFFDKYQIYWFDLRGNSYRITRVLWICFFWMRRRNLRRR